MTTKVVIFSFLCFFTPNDPPVIGKFSFWRMTAENPREVYACVSLGEAYTPGEIADRSICIDGDIGEILKKLK